MPFPPSHARSRGDVPQNTPRSPPHVATREPSLAHAQSLTSRACPPVYFFNSVPFRAFHSANARSLPHVTTCSPVCENLTASTASPRACAPTSTLARWSGRDDVIDRTALECDVAMTVCISHPDGVRRSVDDDVDVGDARGFGIGGKTREDARTIARGRSRRVLERIRARGGRHGRERGTRGRDG